MRDRRQGLAELARRTAADDIFEPGPIDLAEREPTPAVDDRPRKAWLAAWLLICALGAAFCIGMTIWLDANLPAITECRL